MHGVLVATYSRHDLPYSSSSPPYRRQSQANIQRFVLPFSKRHTVNEHILNASGHEQKKKRTTQKHQNSHCRLWQGRKFYSLASSTYDSHPLCSSLHIHKIGWNMKFSAEWRRMCHLCKYRIKFHMHIQWNSRKLTLVGSDVLLAVSEHLSRCSQQPVVSRTTVMPCSTSADGDNCII